MAFHHYMYVHVLKGVYMIVYAKKVESYMRTLLTCGLEAVRCWMNLRRESEDARAAVVVGRVRLVARAETAGVGVSALRHLVYDSIIDLPMRNHPVLLTAIHSS